MSDQPKRRATDRDGFMCQHHMAIEARQDRTERDVQDVWKAIDGLRRWIVGGVGMTAMTLGTVLLQIVIGK